MATAALQSAAIPADSLLSFKAAPAGKAVPYAPGSKTLQEWTTSASVRAWVEELIQVLEPRAVHLIEGTEGERKAMINQLVLAGTFVQLNPEKRPNSYLARSTPSDVARVEGRTFICSADAKDAGATNNWMAPDEMRETLHKLYAGCMRGRTMYVAPFCMGPLGSPYSKVGVQITDSAYAVVNMEILARVGRGALSMLESREAAALAALPPGATMAQKAAATFVRALHSVGAPLEAGKPDSTWPDSKEKYISQFPETREIMSFGSGYGGNALLGKKCFALRIASVLGRDEGWLAEHMLISRITPPPGYPGGGKPIHVCAAFPSACGKTNFAMMMPTLPGWKVETLGDDIAWLYPVNGRLRAINPENGFFGVAPGTSAKSNPNALAACRANSIFTNVAVTPDGDVWWEGMTDKAPEFAISWLRKEWTPGCGEDAAHANARFTAPAAQCPSIADTWESPEGVPIDAIIFGGRRPDTIPLVYEALSWRGGVFAGATVSSELTAAAEGKRGTLRYDPFAMRPFCGYNMASYFKHWLNVPKLPGVSGPDAQLPRLFMLNVFRKNAAGKFAWPGFGDNSRIIKWMYDRIVNPAAAANQAVETPIGFVPSATGLDLSGLEGKVDAADILKVDPAVWKEELAKSEAFLRETFGEDAPTELLEHAALMQARCDAALAGKPMPK